MKRLITLFILSHFLMSSLIAQYEYEGNFDPIEQFAMQRLEQDLFPAKFGFALGLVDSVRQQEMGGSVTDTSSQITPVNYIGDNMSFSYTSGDTSGSFFVYEEYTIPVVEKVNGTSTFKYFLILCRSDPISGLTCDTSVSNGELRYEDGLLKEKTLTRVRDGIPASREQSNYDFIDREINRETSFYEDLSAGTRDLEYEASFAYNALGRTESYSLVYGDEPGDTTTHFATINTDSNLDLTVNYGGVFWQNFSIDFALGELVTSDIVDDTTSSLPDYYDFYRFDDGADDRLRAYVLLGSSSFLVTRFYYKESISSSQELPLIEGQLISANPTRAGLPHKIIGLSQSVNLQVMNVQGQVVQRLSNYQSGTELTWNDLPTGSYFIVCSAPGYAPRAWPIISQ